MKLLLIITSVFIAFTSVLLFKHKLLDIATATVDIVRSTYEHHTTTSQDLNEREEDQQSSQNTTPVIINNNHPEPTEHLFADEMSALRSIRKIFLAVEQAEGKGARVRRSIGGPNLRNFSPFLLMDHFSVGSGAGFPDQ